MQKYIYSLPVEKTYPVIERLKEMRDNGEMPDPDSAAKYLIKAMTILKQYESGAFVDVRDIGLA